MQLGVLNLGILGLAGLAGYLLSGRTLKPIEEMLDEQKRFVSDASHELRTPLTAMRTETEVALLCNKLDPADAKEVLESNLEEIGKLQLLADNLLTLGKYEAATYKLNVANVDLAEVFEDALERVRPMAQARNIELESSINSSIVLHADKEPLTRMFVIFLDNAIKYGLENSKVIMSAHTLKNKAVISIQDFGIGIFADDLPHIFNRFYRVDTARTKTGATGYGLGLSIAKDIIDLHHGNVAVTSTPDEGTTFTVTLPHVFS
ncbi:MAG TPA: HAMP domain-containing sensor histidine kinase [Candidatus Aquicultor sp.]